MFLFSRKTRAGPAADEAAGEFTQEMVNRSEAGRKIPVLNRLTMIRHVDEIENVIVDWAWKKYAVWEVQGVESGSETVLNGWMTFLNTIEHPVQLLVRQHRPAMGHVRSYYMGLRPESMMHGRIAQVANSLVAFLEGTQRSSNIVWRRYYVICDADYEAEINSQLVQGGFSINRLVGTGLWEFYSGCASGMGAGHQRDSYQAVVRRNYVEFNERYGQFYDVYKWPRSIDLMFVEKLFQSGEELDLSLWIWPMGGRESHSRLIMQKSRAEGSRLYAAERGKMIPPDVEATIEDVSRLLREVEKGVARLYRVTMTVGVYGRTQADLKRAAFKVVGHYRARMSAARVLTYRHDQGFRAVLPACRRGVGEQYVTDTQTMMRLFPFSPPDMYKGSGTLFGLDIRSRSPVLFDPFAFGMNAHQVIMARSGAGKSFYVKLRAVREVARSIPYYVIDPDGEYGTLAGALGGTVLVPGRPGHGLNPFGVKFTGYGDLMLRVGGLASLIDVMLQGEVDQNRKAMIDRCLVGFYGYEMKRHGVSPRELLDRQPDLGEGGMESFYDYLRAGHEQEDGEELANLLQRFATGTVQYLMSGSGLDLFSKEAPITTFNMRNLSANLKPVATSVCSEVVWGLAISQPRNRFLVVDECWAVLATPSGADAMITIAKRARKYRLGLIPITQDVQDFLSEDANAGAIGGHAGISLLQNSGSKMILSQDAAALPLVAAALQLNDDCMMFLKSCVIGHGLLITDAGKFPVQVVSTPEERDLLLDDSWRSDGEGYDPALEMREMDRIMSRYE